jgi:uncharacterized membrane protein
MNQDQPSGDYPEHLREAAETIDALRSERHRQMSAAERGVQHFMGLIGRPRFIIGLVVAIVLWIALNLVLRQDHAAFDTRDFATLNTIAGLSSFILVFAILSHQNTQSTIEQERARLLLQMLVIQDRKITQALNSLEDLRREHPRIDTSGDPTELHQETDLHAAARALHEAEGQEGVE